MVVCHCLALNDAAIADMAREGCATVDEVVANCGAGGDCGGCIPMIEEVLAKVSAPGDPRVGSAA